MKYTAIIFLLCIFRTFFSDLFPEEIQAKVWNFGGSISILVILYMFCWRIKSYLLLTVICFWTYEELLVIIGTLARLTIWKNLPVSLHQTSDIFGLPLGLISISFCGYIAVLIYKENKRAAFKP